MTFHLVLKQNGTRHKFGHSERGHPAADFCFWLFEEDTWQDCRLQNVRQATSLSWIFGAKLRWVKPARPCAAKSQGSPIAVRRRYSCTWPGRDRLIPAGW